jgi:signal transduction histidine kinase
MTRLAGSMTDLLAEQNGLYWNLANKIVEWREAQRKLADSVRIQRQTYLDVGHQLRTPVLTALQRVGHLLTTPLPPIVKTELEAIHGSLAWAKTIAWSIKLFSDLAETDEIHAHLSPVDREGLETMIGTAVADHMSRLEPEKEIGFRIEKQGFAGLDKLRVEVDMELLEHAVHNLLGSRAHLPRSHSTKTP